MSVASQENTLPTKFVWTRILPSWLAGSVGAYFLTGFFSNFYPRTYQFIALGFLFSLFCGTTTFLLLNGIPQKPPAERSFDPLALVPLLIVLASSIWAVLISWQFPGLFQRSILFMDLSRLPFFILLAAVSLLAFGMLLKVTDGEKFVEWLEQTRFFQFIRENRPGLLLAAFFLFTYLVFAESINFPGFRTLDQFFDTDISEWLARLTSTTLPNAGPVRAVHPAVLLFLRPPVWLLSIFLNGNRLQAVFLMNALAGAGCVLLTWLIVKHASGNTTYSLIMASILGASCAHLLFGSMLETYIYSALTLLFFTFLVQREYTSLRYTLPAGILVFGITVTNLIQTCILYFFNYPRIKAIIKYVLILAFAIATLNLVQVWIYPNARSLFRPANLAREEYYIWNPLDFSWRTRGRFALVTRAIPLYGIVAPTPFVSTQELDVISIPYFRTYQIYQKEIFVATYHGLADVTVKFWILLLAMAGILFVLNLFKSRKQALLPLSLLLCVGFSFALHVVYGDDPLLYSPNWVYALVLFVALTFQRWADRRWLQLLLIAFLLMLITTNLGLIHQILAVSAPFYGTGK